MRRQTVTCVSSSIGLLSLQNVLAQCIGRGVDGFAAKQANVSETTICQKLMQRRRSKALSCPYFLSIYLSVVPLYYFYKQQFSNQTVYKA